MDNNVKEPNQQPWKEPDNSRCILRQPLMIVIPKGGMTIGCPCHPNGHHIRGSEVSC